MQANECRFGNLIKYGGSITQLDTKEMVHFFRFPEAYEPIPLTEEWLLKLGFEKSEINSQFNKDLLTIQIPLSDIWHPKGRVYFNSWAINNECPLYIHQLQNLYFALTGEELTIKQ